MNEISNQLLERQLRKFELSNSPPNEAVWAEFLAAVAQAYHHAEQDRSSLERSLAISSAEMKALYQKEKFSYESRLRSIFSTIQDLIWLKDKDGVYLSCNPKFESFFGANEAEIIGKTDYDFVEKSLADFFRKNDQIAMLKGAASVNEEFLTFAENGYSGLFETVKMPIYDVAGELSGVLGIARDITKHRQAESELQESEFRWKFAIEGAGAGLWDWDIAKGTVYLSKLWKEMIGYAEDEIGSGLEEWEQRLHPEDKAATFAALQKCLRGEAHIYTSEHRFRCKDNRYIWVLDRGMVVQRSEDGSALRMIGMHIDTTERKQAEEHLRVAAVAFETHEAIMITDATGRILRVNKAFQDITGYSADEVVNNNPRILNSGLHDKAFFTKMWEQLVSAGGWSGEIWDRRKSGEHYPKWMTITAVKNQEGVASEYVAIFSDITARKLAEEEIRNLAFYDGLTRLPNRRLLLDRLEAALLASARTHYYGALLFLDMDRFKTLNDTLGHDYGDLLLIEVAERIKRCVRDVDTVARLGGDEFVVLIEEVDSLAELASQKVALIADKIRQSLAKPYALKDKVHHSSPSIGVSLFHGIEESVDSLLKHADLAMYQAKESGRNAVRFFDPTMQSAVETRARLEADLRYAVSHNQLQLYYQVQIGADNKPTGAEVLVRWNHPIRGTVSPAQFIPIAEESSLIVDIGDWVLESTCRQLANFAKMEQTRDLVLAANVSALQFRQADFVDKVVALLSKYEIHASRLKLELTEGVVLNNINEVVTKMHALKALGITLSMDDFGTGYSSLSYLTQLPLDQLKIDQSFVRNIATHPNAAVMVKTIIDMALNFGLHVIAEGVEDQEQLTFLTENNCLSFQGYFFSKPLPFEQFEALMNEIR